MFSGDTFRSFDIKESESGESMEQKDLSSIPTLEQLKNKVRDILDTDVYEKANISETPSFEDDSRHLVTLDDGTAIEIPELGVYENIRKTDDNGTIYFTDGELVADTTYELNGNTYTTDEQGRIVHCEAKPERSPENPRDVNAQLHTGGADRHSSDQGGHIVGRDLNGEGGVGNLIAMDSRINQSDYKRMENDIKASLDDGKDVSMSTDILYYSEESKRPDIITTTITADGVKAIYKFDNNLDGGLNSEVPASGKSIVNEEMKDTKGTISSIKEIYNESNSLSETNVSITYTDENGVNHRTKVYIDAE